MNKGQIADAERKAINELDKWNDVTGAIEPGSSWYYELQSVTEDAVHIGIQMALYGKVEYDTDGQVKRQSTNNVFKRKVVLQDKINKHREI